jgi:L-ascorbate metabolism protein UlaG (beta-lactamase superfamily)
MNDRAALEITWLGQSGYALRLPTGETCWIDPYLSDYVEDELGVPRIVAAPLDPQLDHVDVVVITHWHQDHLDAPTCKTIAKASPEAMFVCPPSCAGRLAGWRVQRDRIVELTRGEEASVASFGIRGTFARHDVPGWLAEDAIALVIDCGGARIFHSGDTEYDSRCLEAKEHGPFDVGIFVTNGSGGNMNAREAALMAHELAPGVAIPSHYGMWAPENYGPTATLDPQVFVDYCDRLGGPPALVLEHGIATTVRGRTGAAA